MKAAALANAVIMQAARTAKWWQVGAWWAAAIAVAALFPTHSIPASSEGRTTRGPVAAPVVVAEDSASSGVGRASGAGPGAQNDLVAQIVVESDSPRDPDLVPADEPLVRIGVLDGSLDYIFGEVTGGLRLADGSVVVVDEQSHNVRRFDADGRHLWTSGRRGEGPGEYGGLRLLAGCPGAAITVFDWNLNRITELDPEGRVANTRSGVNPYDEPVCAPDGGLVFTPWPDNRHDILEMAPGEQYRWEMTLNHAPADGEAVALRSGIPGTERIRYGGGTGPRQWGKGIAFAVGPGGAWFGSADDYELEHVDWMGRITRVARWRGPELEVTRAHLERYLDAWLRRYDSDAERRRFEREEWPEIRDQLPERFPAYERLLSLPGGGFWAVSHGWRAPVREIHLFDAEGAWVRRATAPAGSIILDAGADWLLVSERDELDVQRVAVYRLVEKDG